MKKLCVIGSFNIDVIAKTERMPLLGETVRCSEFALFIGGGKGANQAVAAGRLGADVMMVGRLGDQFYGEAYLEVLEQNGVGHTCVDVIKGQYPGRAFVASDQNGDNILFIHPGTNALVSIDYIRQNWPAISACDLFLLQYEIPLETNLYLLEQLHAAGKTIILDPAPAMDVPEQVYAQVDYLTPNEVEIQQITGVTIRNEQDLCRAVGILRQKGARTIIAKAGKQGAYLFADDTMLHVPACRGIQAIDTTAAGDSFNAGFAYSLALGRPLSDSVRFANVVAGLSTTQIGAQNAMPTIGQVEAYLAAEIEGS